MPEEPDPGAKFVNAFHINYFYCFPAFSAIAACLQKREFHKATGISLVPLWKTQAWLTTLLHLLIGRPLLLPQSVQSTNTTPQRFSTSLAKTTLPTDSQSLRQSFLQNDISRKAIQKMSYTPGQLERWGNTNITLEDGSTSLTRFNHTQHSQKCCISNEYIYGHDTYLGSCDSSKIHEGDNYNIRHPRLDISQLGMSSQVRNIFQDLAQWRS